MPFNEYYCYINADTLKKYQRSLELNIRHTCQSPASLQTFIHDHGILCDPAMAHKDDLLTFVSAAMNDLAKKINAVEDTIDDIRWIATYLKNHPLLHADHAHLILNKMRDRIQKLYNDKAKFFNDPVEKIDFTDILITDRLYKKALADLHLLQINASLNIDVYILFSMKNNTTQNDFITFCNDIRHAMLQYYADTITPDNILNKLRAASAERTEDMRDVLNLIEHSSTAHLLEQKLYIKMQQVQKGFFGRSLFCDLIRKAIQPHANNLAIFHLHT